MMVSSSQFVKPCQFKRLSHAGHLFALVMAMLSSSPVSIGAFDEKPRFSMSEKTLLVAMRGEWHAVGAPTGCFAIPLAASTQINQAAVEP